MARDVVPADVADISIDEILAIKHPDPPRWSPDGRWLAWRWDDGGQVSLWVSRSDGSGQKQVSQGEASVGAFDWSPDGRLAYSQDSDIWIAQPNSNQPSQITRGAEQRLGSALVACRRATCLRAQWRIDHPRFRREMSDNL